ncbi:MAG: hypothetical protein CME26_11885 [Gemmatimonadetes bacterium]|nr:hypothetical protein [Gemmatimonadota bacterium]
MVDLGLGYEDLRKVNPAIVLTSITPFGQSGPYRDYGADELLVYAMGGCMSTTGIRPGAPVRLASESSSYLAGAGAAGVTLTALWKTATDGEGDHIDLSMVECLLGAPDRKILDWEYRRIDEARIFAPRPLQNFPCQDGFFAIGLARGLQYVAEAMDQRELLEDKRFATGSMSSATVVGGDVEYAAELDTIISTWTMQHTRREIFEQLQRYRVIAGPINDIVDLVNDPQFQHRESFVPIMSGGQEYRVPQRPYREIGIPLQPLVDPPTQGQHTQDLQGGFDRERRHSVVSTPRNSRVRPTIHTDQVELPLAGIRVIDFGEAFAGPYCCTLLADAGAEVIRVENIHRMPANQRGQPNPVPPYLGYKDGIPGERPWNRFGLHNSHERNKYGVTLDVKQPRGRELFLQLVSMSDIVVANFSRSAMASLHVEYDDLISVNPELIMTFISGYGVDGPYRDYAALGSTIDAVSAHQSLRGDPESTVIDNQHSYFSDTITAYTAFFAVMSALHRRRNTGQGILLDMALTESMFPVIGGPIAAYSATGELPPMRGNRDAVFAPHGCYRSRSLPPDPDTQRLTEDRWIAIACRSEHEWLMLTRHMGREDLREDPRFRGAAERLLHQDPLDEILNEWTERHDATELMRELQSAGVPAMAVMPDSELFDDPHLRARGYFTEIDHRDAGRYRTPGPIWRSRRYTPGVRMPVYCLGEHNREILQGLLGVSDDEFVALTASGVIGEAYADDVKAAHR